MFNTIFSIADFERTLLRNEMRLYGMPTLDILLYVDPSLSQEINQTIFIMSVDIFYQLNAFDYIIELRILKFVLPCNDINKNNV